MFGGRTRPRIGGVKVRADTPDELDITDAFEHCEDSGLGSNRRQLASTVGYANSAWPCSKRRTKATTT